MLPLVLAATTACEAEDAPGAPVVALLVPGGSDRWEQVELPALGEALAEGCADCEVVVLDAERDAERQLDQVAQAVDGGADALVVAPVDAGAGAALVEAAGSVPVVAYGEVLAGADEVVAPDPAAVGAVQAEAVLAALPERPRGRAVVLTGDADEAGAQASAAQRALERAGLAVEVADAGADVVDALGSRAPVAVVAADDATAGEALEALGAAAGRAGTVVVGAGADLDGVRRVVAGEQRATVHVPSRGLAAAAGALAAGLVGGTAPAEGGASTGAPGEEPPVGEGAPAPVAVTADRVAQVLVRDGYAVLEALCSGSTRRACERLGLV